MHPTSLEERGESACMSESASAAEPKPKVVFVVDDEHVIATTLATILNKAGYDAHAFFNGQDVVDSLDKLQPDLLIADVVMPGMNGIEAAIITRTKLPKCKVLLLSGRTATMDLLETARAQGHEFEILAKPVHPTHLLEKIRIQP
jgi:DNA-binding response OmpR family regulator